MYPYPIYCCLKVPEDCEKVFNYCNCLKTADPKVFKLSLHITAFLVNSEADVRTELVYRETTFFSETRNLPIIYSSKTDLVVVYVNGQVVHFQQTDVSINDTQVTIVSVCRENFAHNCKQQISDLETGSLVKSGKEIVVYNTNIKGRSNLNLKYSVCNIERNTSFSITTDTSTDYLHLTTGRNLILIILSTVYIVTLVMMLCFVVFVSSVFAYKKITTQNSADLCFPQDTCGLNVCQKNLTDLADLSSLGDENQDTDPHHFTNDQSKVQSDDVEGPLIGNF
uniref:Uncharacterized protein n=1 Tax=Biomphalaria glabrata TaxID=6526 RepID=A0A2C9LS32_BIOGL